MKISLIGLLFSCLFVLCSVDATAKNAKPAAIKNSKKVIVVSVDSKADFSTMYLRVSTPGSGVGSEEAQGSKTLPQFRIVALDAKGKVIREAWVNFADKDCAHEECQDELVKQLSVNLSFSNQSEQDEFANINKIALFRIADDRPVAVGRGPASVGKPALPLKPLAELLYNHN